MDRDLTIATYRVNLEDALRELDTKNGNNLMLGKASATWLNGQIIAHYAGAEGVHSIRSLALCSRGVPVRHALLGKPRMQAEVGQDVGQIFWLKHANPLEIHQIRNFEG